MEGGRKSAVAPAAGPPGTRVEVRDLFYATPARREFLKSPRTEAEAAVTAVERLAMAWPQVGFRVTVDGRQALNLAPADRAGRIAALLGADFAAAAVPVEAARDGITLTGLAGLPTHHRATGEAQHLVVNNRPVRDPQLRTALRVAYRDLVPARRFPAAALFLDVPPEAVDVNVHPMKTELRFRDSDGVRGLMISALRRALAVGAQGAAPDGLAPDGVASDGWAVEPVAVPSYAPVYSHACCEAPVPVSGWRPPPGRWPGPPAALAPSPRPRARKCPTPGMALAGADPRYLCARGGAGRLPGAGGPARRA